MTKNKHAMQKKLSVLLTATCILLTGCTTTGAPTMQKNTPSYTLPESTAQQQAPAAATQKTPSGGMLLGED